MTRSRPAHRVMWIGAGVAVACASAILVSVFLAPVVPSSPRPARSTVLGATSLSAEEQDVVQTVRTFVDSWQRGDCSTYFQVTTELERDHAHITDCTDFESRSTGFAATVTEASMVVTELSGPDYQYTVTTSERLTVQRDPSGRVRAHPDVITVEYSYDVVPHDDGWAIYWWNENALCSDWSAVLTTPRGAGCGSGASS